MFGGGVHLVCMGVEMCLGYVAVGVEVCGGRSVFGICGSGCVLGWECLWGVGVCKYVWGAGEWRCVGAGVCLGCGEGECGMGAQEWRCVGVEVCLRCMGMKMCRVGVCLHGNRGV